MVHGDGRINLPKNTGILDMTLSTRQVNKKILGLRRIEHYDKIDIKKLSLD